MEDIYYTLDDLKAIVRQFTADPVMHTAFHHVLRTDGKSLLETILDTETKSDSRGPELFASDLTGFQVTMFDNWSYNDGKKPYQAKRSKGSKNYRPSQPNARSLRYRATIETYCGRRQGKWNISFFPRDDFDKLLVKHPWLDEFAGAYDQGCMIGTLTAKLNGAVTNDELVAVLQFNDGVPVVVIKDTKRNIKVVIGTWTKTSTAGVNLEDKRIVDGKVKSCAVAQARFGRHPRFSSPTWATHSMSELSRGDTSN